jgi:hypothetical protein
MASAISGMVPHVVDALNLPWTTVQWVIAVLGLLFMVIVEGYGAFHKAFAPMMAARSMHLLYFAPSSSTTEVLLWILQPLYIFGLVAWDVTRLLVSWGVVVGVTGLVLLFIQLPQPWRGIADLAVVAGLTVGTCSIVGHMVVCLWLYTKAIGCSAQKLQDIHGQYPQLYAYLHPGYATGENIPTRI